MLITLFARRCGSRVELAYDREFQRVKVRVHRDMLRLDRRNRYVMLNCWRWKLEWVEVGQ